MLTIEFRISLVLGLHNVMHTNLTFFSYLMVFFKSSCYMRELRLHCASAGGAVP
jgi:hypothetical protein